MGQVTIRNSSGGPIYVKSEGPLVISTYRLNNGQSKTFGGSSRAWHREFSFLRTSDETVTTPYDLWHGQFVVDSKGLINKSKNDRIRNWKKPTANSTLDTIAKILGILVAFRTLRT